MHAIVHGLVVGVLFGVWSLTSQVIPRERPHSPWLAVVNSSHTDDERFVSPESPVHERPGVSDKVTNGYVFESARLDLGPEQRLDLPEGCHVKEYDGDSVQFFITKRLSFSGHPPAEMRIRKARRYFGLATERLKKSVSVATFGEWRNKDGSAVIKLVVRVPQGTLVTKSDQLHGPDSQANAKRNMAEPKLKRCYWYSGIRPSDGWVLLESELHFNQFLKPTD